MGKTKRCFICGSTKRDDNILHSFPKDASIYGQWKKFCWTAMDILREEDDLTKMVICSKHFLKTDYNNSKYLKSNAVPSILDFRKEGLIDTATLNITNDVGSIIKTEPDTFIMNPPESMRFINTATLNITNNVCSSIKTEPDTFIMNPPETMNGTKTPQFTEYIPTHMTSPKQSKDYFEKSQTLLKKKNKKIKTLQQRCRRLKTRVKKLKDLVRHLKTNFIPEEVEEIILISS